MSDMTDERMIEVLRKEGREYRQEIKGLKDIEYFRTSIIKKLKTENKALRELLAELKEVEETGHLPDGDHVNFSTKMWLERLIKKTRRKNSK